ncbi:response regulator [Eubacterium aggregans]|uniref:response regulator n=1 Tax=Eubacterium aggregans TaxID=81409 RepID=UPI003F356E33
MDIRMPQMNGLDATLAIRHLDHPDAKTIPIIAMTANAFEEDIDASMAAGMDAHLSKPIDRHKLYQTLARLIQQSGERRTSVQPKTKGDTSNAKST